MRYCQVSFDCVARGERRACGCYACDDHTDSLTNLCLVHVPVDEEEYAEDVIANARADVYIEGD